MTVCSWDPNAIKVWSWNVMEALVTVCFSNPNARFGHGGSGDSMLLEPERKQGLVMEALLTVCSWNRSAIMV